MRGLPIVLVLSGCDLALGLDRLTASDAVPGACAHGAGFGAPERIELGATFSAEAVRLDPAQTLAFIALADNTGGPVDFLTTDLYVATVRDGAIQGRTKLAGLSSPSYDSYPTLTRDGEHMIFGSKQSGEQKLELATAVDHSFDSPVITLLDLGSGLNANEPYALGGSDVLYFSAGDLRYDLYRAEGGPETFDAITPLAGLDTENRENAPVVSEDELEIFFASDRATPMAPSVTGLDIYVAERTSTAIEFASPDRVAELSTPDIDYPVWLSPDNCDLYYIQKVNLVGSLYRVRRAK